MKVETELQQSTETVSKNGCRTVWKWNEMLLSSGFLLTVSWRWEQMLCSPERCTVSCIWVVQTEDGVLFYRQKFSLSRMKSEYCWYLFLSVWYWSSLLQVVLKLCITQCWKPIYFSSLSTYQIWIWQIKLNCRLKIQQTAKNVLVKWAYFHVLLLFCDSKLNIFGFLTYDGVTMASENVWWGIFHLLTFFLNKTKNLIA